MLQTTCYTSWLWPLFQAPPSIIVIVMKQQHRYGSQHDQNEYRSAVSGHTPARLPWRQGRALIFGAAFLLLLLGSALARTTHAESAPDGQATIPLRKPTIYLPLINRPTQPSADTPCPITGATYAALPIAGNPIDRPAAQHPDLNLSLRSYTVAPALPGLININGPTDGDAPQLAAIFTPARLPDFTTAYQIYDWDWACHTTDGISNSAAGCRGAPITQPPVTLLAISTTSHELLSIPSRRAQIYPGGYIALVLYAEERQLTLTYTRDDTPAVGYVIHMEDICVDPVLVSLYRMLNDAGRHRLPALRNGDPIGTADNQAKVAVRDTGSFMDPRSRKDWWQGY